MKRNTILLLMLLLMGTLTWAAKAWQAPMQFTQPDGSTLTVYLHGDENFSWYTTSDGVLLRREGNNFYVASITQRGQLLPTMQLAHNAMERKAHEVSLAKAQNHDLFYRQAAANLRPKAPRRREPFEVTHSMFPHMGKPKAVVILVQFADTTFSLPNPRKSFHQYLNGEGRPEELGHGESRNVSSVRQYFKDMSFGLFEPQFDLYGPITLPQKSSYYGNSDGNGYGEKYQELIADACKMMDDSLDFTQYDSNNDGYIDLVYVVYAGYGQNMGAPNETLWPKSFNTYFETKDGGAKKLVVDRCGISNELVGAPGAPAQKLISGIGLFCHEFTHCLGLPDFYPTTPSARGNNQGMELWSLMDDGEYANNGYTPTAYTAWEREAMGWMKIDTLTEAQYVSLKTIDKGGKAYRIMNDADATKKDYYIVQNIQKEGWNKAQGGSGLLVYHVNYDKGAFSLASNSVNNIKGQPRMAVIAADGQLFTSYNDVKRSYYLGKLAGDPFPGTGNVTELTDASAVVNYAPWTGGNLNKPLYNIEEKDGVVSFSFLDSTMTGIEQTMAIPAAQAIGSQPIYSIDGRYMGHDASVLPKGIYIRNHKKFVVK